ncbi:MAG TPA: DUF4249 family protein [Gemmatimonadaceae bacterium]
MGLVLLGSACEIEKVAIERPPAQLALHGMLSATAPSQVVLLEHTRNGSVQLIAPPFDVTDPVVSDEGIAETGAMMTLQSPTGELYVASEDNTTRVDGKGQGIYRFALPGSALQRNAPYRLTVLTKGGATLSAETSVPGGTAAVDTMSGFAPDVLFDRARDTMDLRWTAVPGARSYFVRVETPYGPLSFFTESTFVRFPGTLRNADVTSLPHVFIPGFPQTVTVSAVDSNYYDWYRTRNDEISGEGLVSRVQGGIGVFGSLVRLRLDQVHVVAPQTESIAGEYVVAGTDLEKDVAPYSSLSLYLESPAARSDQPDLLSGRYTIGVGWKFTGCKVCGLFGTVQGTTVRLALLETGIETKGWSARDTADVFIGTVRGDSLVGSYKFRGGPFHFVRQR